MKNILYATICIAFITLISGCGGGDSNNLNEIDSGPSGTVKKNNIVLNRAIQSDQIEIYWQTVPNAISYNIKWGESPDALSHVEHFDANTTMFTHKDISQDTLYYYQLVSLFQEKEAQYSKVLAVKSGSKTQLVQSDEGI